MKEYVLTPEKHGDINSTTENSIGLALVISGVSLAGAGFVGIDSYEAKTPEDAIMSTDIHTDNFLFAYDGQAFVTTVDLGFGAMAGAGLTLGYIGLRKLLHRSR